MNGYIEAKHINSKHYTDMTKAQVKKLIELINAMFREHRAKDSSDHGLTESIRARLIEDELLELCDEEEET